MLSLEIISLLNAETRDEIFEKNSGRKGEKKPFLWIFSHNWTVPPNPNFVTVKKLFAICVLFVFLSFWTKKLTGGSLTHSQLFLDYTQWIRKRKNNETNTEFVQVS